MKNHLRPVTAGVTGLLIILVFGMVLGCSSSSSSGVTSTSTDTTSLATGTTSTAATSTTTPPVTLSSYDQELAKTAIIKNALATVLAEESVSQDDPRMAIMYGLRARMQALTCQKALAGGDLELARTAMTDVYTTINLGRDVAQGSVAELLTDAHAAIETLGDPSDNPETAATLLDKFVDILASLLDQASELTPVTSTIQ